MSGLPHRSVGPPALAISLSVVLWNSEVLAPNRVFQHTSSPLVTVMEVQPVLRRRVEHVPSPDEKVAGSTRALSGTTVTEEGNNQTTEVLAQPIRGARCHVGSNLLDSVQPERRAHGLEGALDIDSPGAPSAAETPSQSTPSSSPGVPVDCCGCGPPTST